MNFVQPLLLLGMAGAAVPLLIHLIGRNRARRIPFAAIDFLLRSNRRVARRLRLRHWLLLAVRMLLVAGLALMVAQPFGEAETPLPALASAPRRAVLVLDDTLSMRRTVEGKTLHERARRRALELVALIGGSAEMAVISLSRPETPLPRLSRDTALVRRTIARLRPGYGHAEQAPALEQAARLAGEAGGEPLHVFLFSDMAAHGDRGRAVELPRGVTLHRVDVAGEGPAKNRAVVGLSATTAPEVGLRAMRITARVCRYGPETGGALELTLQVGERAVARGTLAAGTEPCADKAFHHTFERGGIHPVTVALPPDDLAEDDRRHRLVDVESPVRALLVNGAPSAVRHRDELFYLQAALGIGQRAGRPIRTTVVTADQLARVQLSGYDVVILCNVAGLQPELARALDRFVSRGGGLLLAPGDNTDPAAQSRTLGALLPQPLRGVRSAGGAAGEAPALRIGRLEVSHPVIRSIWNSRGGAGLRSARFRRVLGLSPAAGEGRRVLLWYDDGSPALVEASRGGGRVMLFTSTIDRDWNDLAIRPGYLPLWQQVTRYLARASVEGTSQNLLVGQSVRVAVPPGTRQLRVREPGGEERLWQREALEGRRSRGLRLWRPGFYRVSAAGGSGAFRDLERETLAANLDPVESDPRKAPKTKGTSSKGEAKGERALQRVELWHGVGLGLLLLLLLEGILVRRS